MKYKIRFTYYNIEGNLEIETLNAEKEGHFYKIKNIPFFAPNIAYDDIVSIEDDEGELYFDDIVQESGNSTIQIIIFDENDIESIVEKITSYKCGWEGSHLKGYISINIPKEIRYTLIKQFLDTKSEQKKLDYKEACLAHEI